MTPRLVLIFLFNDNCRIQQQSWATLDLRMSVPFGENKILNKLKYIVLCVKKQKNWWVGHFTTLSGHFLANYINIFHKIELPTIILMCLTCLNLVWIKSYDIFSFPVFYHFVKKKYWKFMTHKWSSWDNFWPFFGQLHENISQKKEVQTVILRCLVCLNLNWIKSYNLIYLFIMTENASFHG